MGGGKGERKGVVAEIVCVYVCISGACEEVWVCEVGEKV